MKTRYEKPETNVVEVELTQLMAGSVIEDGFNIEDALGLDDDIISGNLSRGGLWN